MCFCKNRRFVGTYRLHHLSDKNTRTDNWCTDQDIFDSATCRQRDKCVGAPSCRKCSSRRMISGTSAKKSGIYVPKQYVQFWPVRLFGSTWSHNKLSTQFSAQMMTGNRRWWCDGKSICPEMYRCCLLVNRASSANTGITKARKLGLVPQWRKARTGRTLLTQGNDVETLQLVRISCSLNTLRIVAWATATYVMIPEVAFTWSRISTFTPGSVDLGPPTSPKFGAKLQSIQRRRWIRANVILCEHRHGYLSWHKRRATTALRSPPNHTRNAFQLPIHLNASSEKLAITTHLTQLLYTCPINIWKLSKIAGDCFNLVSDRNHLREVEIQFITQPI
jgi:hypothetical protein